MALAEAEAQWVQCQGAPVCAGVDMASVVLNSLAAARDKIMATEKAVEGTLYRNGE
jgi:hypothetical protein